MKKMLALLAMLALVAPSMAAPVTDSEQVLVNIKVAPTVSFWANQATINLVLDGSNPPDNSAAVASSFGYITNVNTAITATVTGSLPDPTTAGGGIQFSLFGGMSDPAAALAAIHADQYAPAGAKVWTKTTLGTTQTVFAGVAPASSVSNLDIVYAAALPGDLPIPADWSLTVTYTMTQN